jgi:hypothetical protein
MLPATIGYRRIIVEVVAFIKKWRAEEVTVEPQVMGVKFTPGFVKFTPGFVKFTPESWHVTGHSAGGGNKYCATPKVSSTHASVGAGGGWRNPSEHEYQGE